MEAESELNYPYSRHHFDNEFKSILHSSPDTNSIRSYIRYILYKFKLNQTYEVDDILVEVYTRGIKFIERGGEVHHVLPWIRRTAYNVIREMSRSAYIRYQDLAYLRYQDLEDTPSAQPDYLSDMMLADNVRAMGKAFQRLNADERDILRLRVVDQMSWQDVATTLAKTTDPSTLAALRKRGNRALQRLRAFYEEVEEVQSSLEE